MKRAKQITFGLVTLSAATAISLAAAESALRLFHSTATQYLAIAPHTRAVFDPLHSRGVQGPSVYQVNSMGARGREWAHDRTIERRILALGGSTTECLYTDQSRVWTCLLEQKLDDVRAGRSVWVGNIGRSGLNCRHHVVQVQHLDVYDPDMVILMAGVNDLSTRLLRDADYDPHFMDQVDNIKRLTEQAFQVIPDQAAAVRWPDDPWHKRTRIWGLLRTIKYQRLNASSVQDVHGESIKRWRQLRAQGKRKEKLPSLHAALDEYERNLNEIIDQVRKYGADLVLLTQATLWRNDLSAEEEAMLWMGGIGDYQNVPGCTYYTASALAQGMHAYNERLISVCRQRQVAHVDLASKIDKTTEFLYDDCHFTDIANWRIAEMVADALDEE